MDEKIKIIQQTSEVTQLEAEKALQLAEGDLDKALQMIDYVSNNYMIIHGKVNYGSYNKTYILFAVVCNGKSGEVLNYDLVSTSEEDLKNINLNIDHKVFIKTLIDINHKTKKNINSKELNLNPKKLFTAAEIFDIFKLAKEEDFTKVKTIFRDKLENIIKEEIDLNLQVKTITKIKLKTYYPELFDNPDIAVSSDDNQEQENEGNGKLGLDINLKCIPIISPSYGKKINELTTGDEILVEINDTREVGKYLAQLLHNEAGKALGKIEEATFNQNIGRYSVLIKFGPNIYGNISISPQLKISTPLMEQRKVKGKDNEEEVKIDQGVFLIFFIAVLIIILLIFILIIF